MKPTKRFACGIDWKQWVVGIQLHKVKGFGKVFQFNVFVFTCYLRVGGTGDE